MTYLLDYAHQGQPAFVEYGAGSPLRWQADFCDDVIEAALAVEPFEAQILGGKDKKFRKADVHWLPPKKANEWLYDAVAQIVLDANKGFGFSVTHLPELQVMHYNGSGYYLPHRDNSLTNHSTRKLSFVAQLSNPTEYYGGDLVLKLSGRGGIEDHVFTRQQGASIVFPSFTWHEVRELTSGERWSLVAWVEGPPFT